LITTIERQNLWGIGISRGAGCQRGEESVVQWYQSCYFSKDEDGKTGAEAPVVVALVLLEAGATPQGHLRLMA
jgi:hypothetical protein